MRSLTQFLFFGLLFIGSYSCSGDDDMTCTDEESFGDFFLEEESKALYPYGDEELVLVFSDSLGNEVKGSYIPQDFTFCIRRSPYTITNPENIIDVGECSYTVRVECRSSKIRFEDLGELEICIQMGSSVQVIYETEEVSQFEFMTILLLGQGSSAQADFFVDGNGQLPLNIESLLDPTVGQNSLELYSFYEDFNLHDKSYSDVYTTNYENISPQLEYVNIYYSNEIGLIGFENTDKSISLKFERVE